MLLTRSAQAKPAEIFVDEVVTRRVLGFTLGGLDGRAFAPFSQRPPPYASVSDWRCGSTKRIDAVWSMNSSPAIKCPDNTHSLRPEHLEALARVGIADTSEPTDQIELSRVDATTLIEHAVIDMRQQNLSEYQMTVG